MREAHDARRAARCVRGTGSARPACARRRRAANAADRVDFVSYADFQAHLLEWGMRCILTKAFEPVVLMGYQWQLCRIAAEHGGCRTAYFYDVAVRQKARGRRARPWVRAPACAVARGSAGLGARATRYLGDADLSGLGRLARGKGQGGDEGAGGGGRPRFQAPRRPRCRAQPPAPVAVARQDAVGREEPR